MKKSHSFYVYIYGFLGLLGLIVFIEHVWSFNFPDYFYNANPNIRSYTGVNVVSRWADFSFFTYHTLIFFSIYCISLFISHIFNFKD